MDVILTLGNLNGLGDHLLFSTLPRRFTEAGHKVYLDSEAFARNDEIMELVWAANPYVLGTSEKKPNAGYINQGFFYETANRFPIGSIEAMERAHGLPPPYSLAPEIHYKPKAYPQDLSRTVLVDFGAVSSVMGPQGISDALTKMQDRFGDYEFVRLTFGDHVVRQPPDISGGNAIHVNTIWQYVDMLAACRAWVGSEAGGQSLAAAVRGEHDVYDLDARPEIVSVHSVRTFNSRGYTYRGVDYRVTQHSSNAGTDYWTPSEVEYGRYQRMAGAHGREALERWRARKPQ